MLYFSNKFSKNKMKNKIKTKNKIKIRFCNRIFIKNFQNFIKISYDEIMQLSQFSLENFLKISNNLCFSSKRAKDQHIVKIYAGFVKYAKIMRFSQFS